MRHGPFAPSQRAFIEFVVLHTLYVTQFLFIYKFTNQSATESQELLHLYLDFELAIPFIPEFFIVYYSVNVMIFLSLFFLEVFEMRRFFGTLILATVIGAVFFYVLPCACGYVRVIPDYEPWKTILTGFYELDEPHNLVPSLHIAYTTTTLLYLREKATPRWYWSFHIWTLAIYSSVILTHQHHLIDIVTGLALSVVVYQIVKRVAAQGHPLLNPPAES